MTQATDQEVIDEMAVVLTTLHSVAFSNDYTDEDLGDMLRALYSTISEDVMDVMEDPLIQDCVEGALAIAKFTSTAMSVLTAPYEDPYDQPWEGFDADEQPCNCGCWDEEDEDPIDYVLAWA